MEEFGSFKMDLFTAESDLDLSVNFSDSTLSTSVEYSRAEKIKALRKLSKILYAHQSIFFFHSLYLFCPFANVYSCPKLSITNSKPS